MCHVSRLLKRLRLEADFADSNKFWNALDDDFVVFQLEFVIRDISIADNFTHEKSELLARGV